MYLNVSNSCFISRRLFHLYTYFFLFYNSISGLVTILRRIVISVAVTMFFLPRLDRPLVIGGLEFLDKGKPCMYAVKLYFCSFRLHNIFGLYTSGSCLYQSSPECVCSLDGTDSTKKGFPSIL